MADLKLGKLPDRVPVKISFTAMPDLNSSLQNYAELYRETYGEEESVATLIPYMLQGFLDADRGFKAWREKSASSLAHDTASSGTNVRQRRQLPNREASSPSDGKE